MLSLLVHSARHQNFYMLICVNCEVLAQWGLTILVYAVTIVEGDIVIGCLIPQALLGTTFDRGVVGLDMQGWY